MKVFKLEEYLGAYEFSAPYLLCCSDAESVKMQTVVEMADEQTKKMWNELSLCYTEVSGLPLFREEIQKQIYPSLIPKDVIGFAGAEDAIFCSLLTLCDKGDDVIVFTPCYQSFLEVPKLRGANVTEIKLRAENEWRIDIDEIKKAIKPNTKCIVINFPHNPTGQIITQEELQMLVEVCRKHGIWLLSDEVYRLLGSPKEGWASNACEVYEKAISIGVMSKAFGMAGLRTGWIAGKDAKILKEIERIKYYTSICSSAPSEVLSVITLRNKDKFLNRNNQIVANNLKLLDEFFAKYSDVFSWVKPQGGCVGFVEYKKGDVNKMAEKLVKEKGVLIMPSAIYDFDGNYFRIGYGRSNMNEALLKFEEFIKENANI